jgi:hypothetical protein
MAQLGPREIGRPLVLPGRQARAALVVVSHGQ